MVGGNSVSHLSAGESGLSQLRCSNTADSCQVWRLGASRAGVISIFIFYLALFSPSWFYMSIYTTWILHLSFSYLSTSDSKSTFAGVSDMSVFSVFSHTFFMIALIAV